VRTFRSAVSGRPEGLHYIGIENAIKAVPYGLTAEIAKNAEKENLLEKDLSAVLATSAVKQQGFSRRAIF
jgi:hypothetical protein